MAAFPQEGCGLFASDGDEVVAVYPTGNDAESPENGFTVPPREHYEALADAESRGWEIGGVFHSHPRGTARPSMVDVMSALDPDWVYLVVGMRGGLEVRAWRIRGNHIDEIEIDFT